MQKVQAVSTRERKIFCTLKVIFEILERFELRFLIENVRT